MKRKPCGIKNRKRQNFKAFNIWKSIWSYLEEGSFFAFSMWEELLMHIRLSFRFKVSMNCQKTTIRVLSWSHLSKLKLQWTQNGVGEIAFTCCGKCRLVLIHIDATSVTIIASSSLQKIKQARMGWLVSIDFLCLLLLWLYMFHLRFP